MRIRPVVFIALWLGVCSPTSARVLDGRSYQEMLDRADLVVIAQLTTTRQTSEKTILAGITPEEHVVGIESDFEVSAVLKGNKKTKKVVLHHYNFDENAIRTDGALLCYLDSFIKKHFLLFLVREPDGRYAPAAGQIDPCAFSVLKLPGAAW